ncbi:hypothetical protein T4C_6171, partial [Trichinella pseudospiralis]
LSVNTKVKFEQLQYDCVIVKPAPGEVCIAIVCCWYCKNWAIEICMQFEKLAKRCRSRPLFVFILLHFLFKFGKSNC